MDFINAVEKPLKPQVVVFLRSQQCGFQQDHPKVCCAVVPKGLLDHVAKKSKNAAVAEEKKNAGQNVKEGKLRSEMKDEEVEKAQKGFMLFYEDVMDFDFLYRIKRANLNQKKDTE